MSKITSRLALAIVFLIATDAQAFKVDTHVWVGQQVINDLEDDGKLNFNLDGRDVQIAIDANVTNAILNNKNEFLIGNLGPDATPDAVVGQTAIHPGVKDEQGNNIGWQTNGWLEYLLANTGYSEKAKSFVYGYLSHSAADIFSHTYINQYAGDIFDLTDEILVEERHFILESYMAKHTPPLKNYLGQTMGAPWQEIQLDDHYAEFVRDTLIYNDTVQNEYRKMPTASHLVAFYDFRKDIDQLAEAGIWHEIDVAVIEIVAAYFEIYLTPEEANMIVNEAQGVIDKLNSGADDVQAFSNALYERLSKYDSQMFSKLTSAVSAMQSAESSWLSKHQEWRRKLAELVEPPNCPKIPVPGVDCGWSGGWFPVWYCWPTVHMEDDPVCNAARDGIIATNNAILAAAEALEQQALNLKNDLIDKTIEVRVEGKKAADSVVKVANALFDLQQTIGADVSPIQSVLRGWRSDIDLAMTAYVKAVTQTMVNTMDPNAKVLEPIETWFNCYHLQLIGVPSAVSNCEFRDSLSQVKESIENIILIVEEATSVGAQIGLPSMRDLLDLRDKLINQLVDKLKQKVSDKIVDMLPPEVQELIVLLGEEVTDDTLNRYFTKKEETANPKGLLMIEDLSDRVKAEMHLIEGKFDPQQYAVAYDAVVLAKMAMLNASEFEQLALASGSVDYPQYTAGLTNVVAQAFESLDGNHQWMPTPPPRPNSLDNYPPVTYTYASPMGFIPWQGDMRDKLFRKIFIGPLSPGVDAPSIIGMPEIVGSAYPYKVCAANPFPDGIQEETSQVIFAAQWNGKGPQLSAYGNMVAWPWDGKVDLWNGQTIQQIGHDAVGAEVRKVSLYNGTLAWIGKAHAGETGYSVFYWDGTFDINGQPNITNVSSITEDTSTTVTNNGFSLSLYEGQIAWTSFDGNDGEIYFWDGTYNGNQPNIAQITDNSDTDAYVSMADGMIAWAGGQSWFNQHVRYWNGGSVQELSGAATMQWVDIEPVSTSNGAIAWQGSYMNPDIFYWDGTFNNGVPNITTVTNNGYSILTGFPSLRNGTISYVKHVYDNSGISQQQVFFWNGVDTFPVSETYKFTNAYSSIYEAPPNAGGSVAYKANNPETGLMEIRVDSSTGICL